MARRVSRAFNRVPVGTLLALDTCLERIEQPPSLTGMLDEHTAPISRIVNSKRQARRLQAVKRPGERGAWIRGTGALGVNKCSTGTPLGSGLPY